MAELSQEHAEESDPRLLRLSQSIADEQPPAVSDANRARHINAALAEARRAESDGPGALLVFRRALVYGAPVLAVAAAFLLFLEPASETPSASVARVLEGQILSGGSALSPGTALGDGHASAGEGGVLELPDGTTLAFDEGSRFRVRPQQGWVLELSKGRVLAAVAPQRPGDTLQVTTPEGFVRVTGTRFEVFREELGPTRVSVMEGSVQVRAAGESGWITLSPGDRFTLGRAPVEVAPAEATTAEATRAEATRAAEQETPEPGHPATSIGNALESEVAGEPEQDSAESERSVPTPREIRRAIAGRQLSRARSLLRRARRATRGRSRLAELAMVEAEADLADGHIDRAISDYLGVSQRYGGTRQAETALFAAAQLSRRHRGAAASSALLRRYLQRYPEGRFADDASALIGGN